MHTLGVLRLRGPLNIGNPRISPGQMLGGKCVPQGVTVEACAYATACDPLTFQDPHRFQPSRWENATPEMRDMSRPFSCGPRNYVGHHLAEISLTPTIVRLFQLTNLDIGWTLMQTEVEQRDQWVLSSLCLTAGHLLLQWS